MLWLDLPVSEEAQQQAHACCQSDRHKMESLDLEPSPDPELLGKTVLLILTGSKGRRRVLRSLACSGVRIICYSPVKNWATEFIADQDWVIGPPDEPDAAQVCVWVRSLQGLQDPCKFWPAQWDFLP